jgi:hypothetical protein
MNSATRACCGSVAAGWLNVFFDLPQALAEHLRKARLDGVLDEQPRGGDAALPRVVGEAGDDGVDRALKIGVGKDDDRALAAELDPESLEAAASGHAPPLSAEPVNEIMATCGDSTSAAPASEPSPVTTL